jgi:hypothetical protein
MFARQVFLGYNFCSVQEAQSMEEKPTGQDEKQDSADQAAQSPPPTFPDKEEATEGGKMPSGQSDHSGEQINPKTKWQRFKAWCSEITFADAVMLLLTLVIAGTGIVGILLVIQGGEDTTNIAEAAKSQACSARKIAEASERNATAAEGFAASAGGIKTGIDGAVLKLQAQADKMEDARKSSERNSTNALQATIDNFHQDQRAWVGIESIDAFNLAPTDSFKIVFRTRNSGRTPALKMHSLAILHSLPGSEKFAPDIGATPGDAINSNSTDAPNGTGYIPTPSYPLTQKQIDAIKSGVFRLYAYGRIDYTDIYGRPHTTTFCRVILPSNEAEGCETYNDMK